MDTHIELQDTDAKFSLFASSTYELAFGGLSVHMNADQFQQLCDNLRPWVVEDTTHQLSADAVREIYDAAAKGFHTSETNGAERKYLHVIRFQSIEDLHGYEDAWTAAMVKARDAK